MKFTSLIALGFIASTQANEFENFVAESEEAAREPNEEEMEQMQPFHKEAYLGPYKPGKCPSQGSIKSRVEDSFQKEKIQGTWQVAYHLDSHNQHSQCYGVRFDILEHDICHITTTSRMSEKKIDHLRGGKDNQEPDKEHTEMYLPQFGNFKGYFRDHKTISDNSIDGGFPEFEHENGKIKFSPTVFDAQFINYNQILDTDYKNFATMYSCQENAEFVDNQTGEHLEAEDAWNHITNLDELQGLHDYQPKEGEEIPFHKLFNMPMQFDSKISVIPQYREIVQILWRPKYVGGEKFGFREIDQNVIDEQVSLIKEKVPAINLSHYEIQNHREECDYNPFAQLLLENEEYRGTEVQKTEL